MTNKKPTQASITKVKQFEGSTSFVRRSQWMLEQLRQVNGIDPNRDSAEFDLLFENAFDQWVASTASEKCTFFQILHHTCQRYLTDRKPEFINCQSKIMGGNSILHSAADSVTSAVQKASQALNERGERLGRAEEKTEDMKNSAQQFAETAHKVGPAEGQRSASGCSGSFTPRDLLQCVSHGGRYKIKIKPLYTPSPIQPAALISTRIVKGFFLHLFLHFSPFQHLYLCL